MTYLFVELEWVFLWYEYLFCSRSLIVNNCKFSSNTESGVVQKQIGPRGYLSYRKILTPGSKNITRWAKNKFSIFADALLSSLVDDYMFKLQIMIFVDLFQYHVSVFDDERILIEIRWLKNDLNKKQELSINKNYCSGNFCNKIKPSHFSINKLILIPERATYR